MIHKFFTWPLKTVLKVGEIIHDEAEKELYDLEQIQNEFVQLEMNYELGEVDEETYVQQEEELLRRFQIAKERELGDFEDFEELEDEEDEEDEEEELQ